MRPIKVTIPVTVVGGHASAPRAVVQCDADVEWEIEGDLGDDDEVCIVNFADHGKPSPMRGKDIDRKRKGTGSVCDHVKKDASEDTYDYAISVTRAASGVAQMVDPQIQIKS